MWKNYFGAKAKIYGVDINPDCKRLEDEQISTEAVWRSLEMAQLDEFVGRLPDKLNTFIGERGVRISGGQRQRIAIARALWDNPEVLIFDEATSALDHETEKEITRSIESLAGQKTIIIVAHRLSTLEKCDVIYRLNKGKIQKHTAKIKTKL